jgi:hypothetical protein
VSPKKILTEADLSYINIIFGVSPTQESAGAIKGGEDGYAMQFEGEDNGI